MFFKRESYEPQDVLVIFKDDGTAEIAPVLDTNNERIHAESSDGAYSIPAADVKAYTGRKGRIFLYPTTVENVIDCQRIAALERSTVLKQITHFADENPAAGKLPIGRFLLIGIPILIILIVLVVQ